MVWAEITNSEQLRGNHFPGVIESMKCYCLCREQWLVLSSSLSVGRLPLTEESSFGSTSTAILLSISSVYTPLAVSSLYCASLFYGAHILNTLLHNCHLNLPLSTLHVFPSRRHHGVDIILLLLSRLPFDNKLCIGFHLCMTCVVRLSPTICPL